MQAPGTNGAIKRIFLLLFFFLTENRKVCMILHDCKKLLLLIAFLKSISKTDLDCRAEPAVYLSGGWCFLQIFVRQGAEAWDSWAVGISVFQRSSCSSQWGNYIFFS